MNDVNNITMEVPVNKIPNGTYEGKRSGYTVEFTVGGKVYQGRTKDGVRGMNIPCKVKVALGKVSLV